MNQPKKKILIGLTIIVAIIVVSIIALVVYLNPVRRIERMLRKNDTESVVAYYNSHDFTEKDKKVIDGLLYDDLSATRIEWEKGRNSVPCTTKFKLYEGINNEVLSKLANQYVSYHQVSLDMAIDDIGSAVECYNSLELTQEDREVTLSFFREFLREKKNEWNNGQISSEDYINILEQFREIRDEDICNNIKEGVGHAKARIYWDNKDIYALVELYNSEELSDFVTAEIEDEINSYIRLIVPKWSDGTMEYAEASNILEGIGGISNKQIAMSASKELELLNSEKEGNDTLELASTEYEKGHYLKTMKYRSDVSSDYSQYSVLDQLYSYSKNHLLSAVGTPQTVGEYEKAILMLDNYIHEVADQSFIQKRDQLNVALQEYRPIYNIIQQATDLYERREYRKSFELLEKGLDKYPDNEQIEYALSAYEYAYIIDITSQVVGYTEIEDYDNAKIVLEGAIEQYDCFEFQEMLDQVKRKSDFWYASSRAIAGAGDYVFRSSKKLLLGDFAPDEQDTLLSLGGNVAASLINVDAPLDIRDLAYDFSHWGQGDYFAARLALDAVGILPVIGVIKYVKHIDTASDVVKTADKIADAADTVHDAAKVADAADDVADVIKTGGKLANKADILADVAKQTERIDGFHDAVNTADTVGDVVEYVPIITRGMQLAGKTHPETGIKYAKKYIDLSDGRRLVGVFPEFPSKVDIQLPEKYFKANFETQKKYLTEELKNLAESPSGLKKLEKFTADEISDLKNGIISEGFIWHHNEQEGLMQLVDEAVHAATGHTGGMSIWGIGY